MPRIAKSSLTDHRFPAFYACYLLKSVRTPRATATYIGSTPSPPRRIRQHNGEISQGAWKTKSNRPWVMQMIVYGFPSKLAALQFEWAWQHPYVSRHLRDNDGNAVFSHSGKFKYLNANVRVARSMVSSHPYNTWPLCVKMFTEEAEKVWNNAERDAGMPPLPPGLRVFIELEGVDGKSGKTGSGRTGPIDVTDGHFTSEHLRKASMVFSSGSVLRCSICQRPVEHDADPLSTTLCPASSCIAVSHLSCLSRHFLDAEAGSSSADMIPRGGICQSCHSYILWGDVIRGCYRRREGGVTADAELEDADDREDDIGQLFGSDIEDEAPAVSSRPVKPSAPSGTKKRSKARAIPSACKAAPYSTSATKVASDAWKHFDFDAITDTSDEQDSDDGHQWQSAQMEASSRLSSSKPSSSTLGGTPNEVNMATTAAPESPFRVLPDGCDLGSQDLSHRLASNAGGRPADAHGFGSRTLPAAPAGQASNKAKSQEEKVPRKSPSMILHSADTRGARYVDLSPNFGQTGRLSCPPPTKVVESVLELQDDQSGAAGVRPSLRPFPNLPPLSPPHRPMGGRGQRMESLVNEVVEISD